MIKTHPKSILTQVHENSSWAKDHIDKESDDYIILQIKPIPNHNKYTYLVEYVKREEYFQQDVRMTELKTCPFCGSDNIQMALITHALLSPDKLYHAKISCRNCLVSISSLVMREEDRAIKHSAEAWNRRVER